jgi:hypothetical protein
MMTCNETAMRLSVEDNDEALLPQVNFAVCRGVGGVPQGFFVMDRGRSEVRGGSTTCCAGAGGRGQVLAEGDRS